MTATLVLLGHTPSKKNLWKRGKSGRMYIDDEVKDQLTTLTLQAQSQWRQPPVRHPDMQITFYVRDKRGDRDNKATAILDLLRDAGVIVNDNIADFNGTLTLKPAIVNKNERTEIEIRWAQEVLR